MTHSVAAIELSQSAITANIAAFRRYLPPGTKIIGVVKANAYGHGLAEIVRMSEQHVDYFQVDDLSELEIVRGLSDKPTCVLGALSPAELDRALELHAILGVYDVSYLRAVDASALRRQQPVDIYLEIDALLGRLGLLEDQVPHLLKELAGMELIRLAGAYAHFANIEDTTNLDHAMKQAAILRRVARELENHGHHDFVTHISATSGILALERQLANPVVRLGIGLYGLWPSADLRDKAAFTLGPVLRWTTQIAQVKNVPAGYPIGYGLTYVTSRPTRIAVIPQGYSDGYDRGLSNCGEVLVGGKRCPITGRVMMNMSVIDVSHVANVAAGDEVVLLGAQGSDRITAEELAQKLGTINYEIIARISPLLPRVVV